MTVTTLAMSARANRGTFSRTRCHHDALPSVPSARFSGQKSPAARADDGGIRRQRRAGQDKLDRRLDLTPLQPDEELGKILP